MEAVTPKRTREGSNSPELLIENQKTVSNSNRKLKKTKTGEESKSIEVRAIDLQSEGLLSEELPPELLFAIKNIYKVAGLTITSPPKAEAEGAEYSAYRLGINGKNVVFRNGKVTSSRPGNFVTLWKRPGKEIVPLDISDGLDFAIVAVSNGVDKGQFIFDRDVLLKKGIFSNLGKEKKGKLSFRVFPPWASPAKSALKTQEWQSKYFYKIPKDLSVNSAKVFRLLKVSK